MSDRIPFLCDLFDYDPREQLSEIKRLLEIVFTWRNELHGEIAEAQDDVESAPVGSLDSVAAHCNLNSLGCHSCSRDAICSQVAVGVLAPFFEGLLVHVFRYLAALKKEKIQPNRHHRWSVDPSRFWDPHVVSEQGTVAGTHDVVRGTMQILKALDVVSELPHSFERVLRALFAYRNRVLHAGYEWPPDVRDRFRSQAEASVGWDQWFAWTTLDNKPWIVSMKDEFVMQCVRTAEEALRYFDALAQRWGGRLR